MVKVEKIKTETKQQQKGRKLKLSCIIASHLNPAKK